MIRFFMTALSRGILIFILGTGFSVALLGQEDSVDPPSGSVPAAFQTQSMAKQPPHRFWDQKNAWLFSGVAGARMLDYASTRHFRDQGNHEVLLSNAIVDDKPLFVGIELGATGLSIGVSYLCHRTGHHRAERWVSIVHAYVGMVGSIHNYTLLPPAPQVLPAVPIQPAAGLVSTRVR
jgi:hypothetical protein